MGWGSGIPALGNCLELFRTLVHLLSIGCPDWQWFFEVPMDVLLADTHSCLTAAWQAEIQTVPDSLPKIRIANNPATH